jgi:hypothetical protein
VLHIFLSFHFPDISINISIFFQQEHLMLSVLLFWGDLGCS